MLNTNFKIAYRHLSRSKVFTLINIVGLAVGITSFFLITQYISFELSFDQFHLNKKSIYRIGLKRYSNNELVETSAKTFPGIRSLLKENFPEVQDVTGFYKTPANTGFLFRHNGKIYNEPGGVLNSDSAFFKVFPSFLIRGDAATALKEPNSLILSESLAKKIFGEEEPIGQTLDRIDDYAEGTNYIVKGILKDIPENSHIHATIIEHIHDHWPESDEELWGEGRLSTYVTLSENSRPDLIEEKLNVLIGKLSKENILVKNTKVFLQPITGIHLSSDCKDELETNGNESLLYLLGIVGVIILAIAWINYINMETSRFVLRLKEFGIRRVIGSGKLSLAIQLFTEYFCLTMAAIILSLLFLVYLSPHVSNLIGVPLERIQNMHFGTWGIALILFLLGSILAGTYPAIFLLRFSPVSAVKGMVSGYKPGSRVRQSLVIFQFTASVVLIGFVMSIDKQLDFMQLLNKGVELETVIALRNPTAYSNQDLTDKYGEFNVLESKLLQSPFVKSVASSSAIPGSEIGFSYINLIKRNMGDPYDPAVYKTLFVSEDFIPTYDLELLAGENFSTPGNYNGAAPWETENWSTIILNERAIRQLGFRSVTEAVNQEVYFQAFDEYLKCRIIGVIKDYHHEAAKKEIYPTILFHNFNTFQQVYYSIRLNAGGGPKDALTKIEQTWKEIFPGRPFEYFFLDEYYDRQLKSEIRFQRLFVLFAGIAMLVACLGVLGMTLFEMNSRLKEISIRKVLGATVLGLVVLLSRKNVRSVLVSATLGIPFIYFLTNKWLSNYPNRIEFTPLFILVPLAIILVMVMLVSAIQTLSAAESNPIKHLKND